jgi:hypothetical protein
MTVSNLIGAPKLLALIILVIFILNYDKVPWFKTKELGDK